MQAFRLDSISCRLADLFRHATPSGRRQAARIACEAAASSAGLTGREVVAATARLRTGAAAGASLRGQLEALAARLDGNYLRLDQNGDPSDKSEALRVFSKARAASALAFALSSDTAGLHEAIYEAVVAMNDPGELIRLVEEALR
jgi:hypothetical protein